jgi:hypothetical protein
MLFVTGLLARELVNLLHHPEVPIIICAAGVDLINFSQEIFRLNFNYIFFYYIGL